MVGMLLGFKILVPEFFGTSPKKRLSKHAAGRALLTENWLVSLIYEGFHTAKPPPRGENGVHTHHMII